MLRGNRRSLLLTGIALCALAGLASAQTRVQSRGPAVPTYQAVGTGSVSRTVASKLGDVLSVKDFGADGIALAAAIGALPSTGGTVYLAEDITISTPLTLTMAAGRPVQIDLQGHTVNLTHTSGVGLTINGGAGSIRQPFSLRNGRFVGSATAGITGLELINLFGGSVRDLGFIGFSGASQIVMLLDNVEDVVFDNLIWYQANGTGTIAFDVSNNSNANRYSGFQFQQGYQAIRLRGGASGVWFSDCLVQSNTAVSPVVVQSTGTDTDSKGVHFDRCWWENNGDGTANAAMVTFTTDVGHAIHDISITRSMMNGNANGTSGTALAFSATGTPCDRLETGSDFITNAASTTTGLPVGATWISNNDFTLTSNGYAPDVQLGGDGARHGIGMCPSGASRCFTLFTGDPANSNGNFVIHDETGAADIFAYIGGSSEWRSLKNMKFVTGVAADGGGFKHKRGTAGCATGATVGSACTTVVTWTTAFPDANYTATCGGRVVTSGVPTIGGITAQVAASVTVQTVSSSTSVAQFTNIDCIAVHD